MVSSPYGIIGPASGYGILGGNPPVTPPGGAMFGGGFRNFVLNNPALVSTIGATLLGGQRPGGGYDFSGLPTAMTLDTATRQSTADRAAADQRRAAMNKVIQNWKDIDPNMRQYYLANPEAFGDYVKTVAAPAKPTDDISEYNYAKGQGYTGSFTDWVRDMKKAGATTVNVGPSGESLGDPPKDMTWARDEAGNIVYEADPQSGYRRPVAVPIGGGPAAAAAKGAAEGAQQRKVYADIVTQDIDRAIEGIKSADNSFLPATGIPGAVTRNVPGTAGFNVGALIETVKANVGFDKLQVMRMASPTGGAVGQVSDFENRLMQATIGNLDQAQTKDQLLFNLERVRQVYEKIVNEGIKPGDPIANEILGAIGDGSAPAAPAPPAIASPPAEDGWTDLGNGVRIRKKP